MSLNLVTLLYLVASVCFIQALKGLSHPTTSIRGNVFGMIGMAIAVVTTAALIVKLAGLAAGHGLGAAGPAGRAARRRHDHGEAVEMTKMPELVAFMHSMIGLAAVFIAWPPWPSPGHAGSRAARRFRTATGSSCSWARPSARSPSAAR
jgi:NAD(P) transhydrogenase subunit beta